MKIIALLLLISCTTTEKERIYHLDHDGLYRSQANEFIPIGDLSIPNYYCLERKDLFQLLQRTK